MKFLHLFFVLGSCVAATSAHADCATDKYADVYCSRFPGGGAMPDKYNNVNCGKGQCLKDKYGDVYCSKLPGGGAGVDRYSDVLCTSGCERGTSGMCERGVR